MPQHGPWRRLAFQQTFSKASDAVDEGCLARGGVRPVWLCGNPGTERPEEMQETRAAEQRGGWVLAVCSWACRALLAPFICSAWDVISPGTYLPSSWSAWGTCLLLLVVIPFDQQLRFFSSVCDGLISTLLTKVCRSWYSPTEMFLRSWGLLQLYESRSPEMRENNVIVKVEELCCQFSLPGYYWSPPGWSQPSPWRLLIDDHLLQWLSLWTHFWHKLTLGKRHSYLQNIYILLWEVNIFL